MRLDAHQHFWNFDPVRDAWIDETMVDLRRDFLPADLQPLLKTHHIDGCVAVQADQSESETRFLLDLAAKYDFIKAVVGWADLSVDNIGERLAYWKKESKLAGFRHILQSEPMEKMRDKNFRNGIANLASHGFTYDVLIYHTQLAAAMDLIDAFPNQPFVVDHLAKPAIGKGTLEPWRAQMRELGKRPHVMCKLSGMITEADHTRWRLEDLEPFMETVLESFGTKRLMFGSDWPVCLLAGDYARVVSVAESFISRLSPTEQTDIMGATACQFYKITN